MGQSSRSGKMGNRQPSGDTQSSTTKKAKAPRGIVLREFKHTQSIQISFSYRGVRCRESLSLPHTSANIKYAERLKSEIQNSIERGTFDYSAYFPNSPKLKLFGEAVSTKTVGDV